MGRRVAVKQNSPVLWPWVDVNGRFALTRRFVLELELESGRPDNGVLEYWTSRLL